MLRSAASEPNGGDTGRVRGELTIRGVTQPVTLDVTFDGEIKDPSGNRRHGFTAEGVLYRKNFGMTQNQILDTVDVLVRHKVKVTSKVEVVGKR